MAKSKKDHPIFGRFDALIEAMDAHMKKIQEEGKGIVKSVADDLFQRHEDLLGIRWTQYTQFFNDGDECHFRVHDCDVLVKQPVVENRECKSCNNVFSHEIKFCPNCGAKQKVVNPDEPDWSSTYDDGIPQAILDDINLFEGKIQEIDDAMKYAFGDHKRITITRDAGIKVSDYSDHD